MDVAVGRLQFSVRLADARSTSIEEPKQPRADPVETAFRRERSYQEVAEDRERWAGTTPNRGGLIR
jgi:hypothetical protein